MLLIVIAGYSQNNKSFTIGYKHCGITFGNPYKCSGICFGNPDTCYGIRLSLFCKRKHLPVNPIIRKVRKVIGVNVVLINRDAYSYLQGINFSLFSRGDELVIEGLNLSIINFNSNLKYWDEEKGMDMNLISGSGLLTLAFKWGENSAQIGIYNHDGYEDNVFQLGVLNYGRGGRGLQLGVLNYARGGRGLQLGAINCNKWSNGFRILPFLNVRHKDKDRRACLSCF